MNLRELEAIIDSAKEDEILSEAIMKTTLFVLYSIEQLIDNKLVEGKKLLTPKGVRIAKKLIATGWEPDHDIMISVFATIASGGLFPSEEDENEENYLESRAP